MIGGAQSAESGPSVLLGLMGQCEQARGDEYEALGGRVSQRRVEAQQSQRHQHEADHRQHVSNDPSGGRKRRSALE